LGGCLGGWLAFLISNIITRHYLSVVPQQRGWSLSD
jgi:hypothetical protein